MIGLNYITKVDWSRAEFGPNVSHFSALVSDRYNDRDIDIIMTTAAGRAAAVKLNLQNPFYQAKCLKCKKTNILNQICQTKAIQSALQTKYT